MKPFWDRTKKLKGKKILLWSEQGVDTVNWCARIPFISSQAKNCILECQEKLVPLLARSFPDMEVRLNRKSDLEKTDFDFHMPLGSIIKHFLPEITKIKRNEPFLVPDKARIDFWKERLKSIGNGPYVGIAWKSSNMSAMRMPNYAPLSAWSPLFNLKDVIFVNLQYSDFEDDLETIANTFGAKVHNFKDLDLYNDLDDMAALSAALTVTVSTIGAIPLITAGVGTLTKLNVEAECVEQYFALSVGPSVDIFEKNTWEPWEDIFVKLLTILL